MTARLDLLAHGASAATRAARFPDDEALEASAVGALQALKGRLRPYAQVLTSPARAACETAAALGFDAEVETALRDCDYGRWRGLASKDVAEREPDAFAAWLGDAEAAPHGGESVAALIERVGAWLTQSLARDGSTLAVTHAAVVRAATVTALGAGSSAFARIDVAPLSLARLSGHAGRWNLVALGPWRPVVRGALVALIASLFMLSASPSQAHRISTRDGPPPAGVSIPSLTHGQMVVIRDNLGAIRALASARLGFDLTTWRLEDYLNLQSFACLWGVVPGSITDEDSPFNECAHAYLAAGRALLLQLAREPGADHQSIDALISKIEVEMLAGGASLNLCRYSDEPFNTNEVIWPHWGMIPFHPRTAMLAAVAFAAMGAAVWGAWPRRVASSLRSLEGETAVKFSRKEG